MAKYPILHRDGLPTSIRRMGLCPKGHSGNTARGCQLVGRPFLCTKNIKNGLDNIMSDKSKIPKKRVTIEFGSDDFLDALHSFLHLLREEREAMEKRHRKIMNMFMQDIKLYKEEKNYDESDKHN